ncbi:MAG: metallo-mystery pair system four-Cys motif protein [Zoogloea sp.]|nr:metallo-mystery pair system four-Cys motif protein [Zoogloea sp.]
MFQKLLRPLPVLCLLAAGAAGAADQPVRIRFAAEVNGAPFACGRSYEAIGRSASRITPTDLRFYVSQVALITEDGRAVPLALEQDGAWQYRDVTLLDFEDGSGPCSTGNAASRVFVAGTVQAGRYRGLRFTLGVPFELNHADLTTAPPPLNVSGMFWAWQNGHRFFKLEMATSGLNPATRAKGRPGGFPVHLGSTACSSGSATEAPTVCLNPNRAEVVFEDFDPVEDVVVADIGRLLAGADVDQNRPNTSAGCMSFPGDGDCPPIMGALGLPYDGQPAQRQSFFSKGAK